jgi:hypothetical protein
MGRNASIDVPDLDPVMLGSLSDGLSGVSLIAGIAGEERVENVRAELMVGKAKFSGEAHPVLGAFPTPREKGAVDPNVNVH